MKQTLIVILILISNYMYSQTSDDFTDGNFTENPEWVGSQSLFKVNSLFQLQLNDDKQNQAYLSTTNAMVINTEWRCWIKLSFSPSGNNFARYYLVSDKSDLFGALNGYFLQFGEPGSNDAIELFRQDGDNTTSICRGEEGIISSSFEIRIKVTHDDLGNWKIFVDKSGGEDFTLDSEGNDNTYLQTANIGYYCKYTSSNSTKMYFDFVYAGPIIIDNNPPVLQAISAETDTTTVLQFNELLNQNSVVVINNYIVNNNVGSPTSAVRDEVDPSKINLLFNTKFELNKNYTMTVNGVKDLAENTMDESIMDFSYYTTQVSDIVINEIMADPTPPVELPDFEYLELYNQTNNDVDLNNWTLTIGTSVKVFSQIIIPAKGFLIVAKNDAQEELSKYGEFYGFSSFSLTNSGQKLVLRNNKDKIISQIEYNKSWYKNPEKEEGGWSIEQINPANICSGSENWTASNNNAGGTPGKINSVYSNIILYPKLLRLTIIDEKTIQLFFNQSMKEELLLNTNMYEVDSDVGTPKYIHTFVEKPYKVELYFDKAFYKGTIYNLHVSNELSNCINLKMRADTNVSFGLPEPVAENDIVINEILFNPWTGGYDYVELYNRSNKVIDVSTLKIGSIKHTPPNPADTINYNIITNQYLLMPHNYSLLTSVPEAVKNQYYTTNPNVFIKVYPFPSYNNSEGVVLLTSTNGMLIDSLHYSEAMQFPLLIYYDGVALERINPDNPSYDKNNWHSAAEDVGFGTPGYQNSQYVSNEVVTDKEIIIEPEIFSPNNDGIDDIVVIKYNFTEPGYVMSVTIYNSDGYPIKKLANNEYLGTEGSISWDGIKDDNSKAAVGIYIFYITAFDTNGNVKKYKKTCVLAAKL